MYEPIIGLEIHVQLKTKTKMFCGCPNPGEIAPPNTVVCPICMGHPGALPTLNAQAVDFGVLLGLAFGGKINEKSKFDRKSYFYPDLPKGYQISQKDLPVVEGGEVTFPFKTETGTREITVRLNRIHLEEDAAKLLHAPGGQDSFVDYNRGGAPLAEIVTEPDLRSPAEAKAFLQELRLALRYLGISDADMEKGQLRCDVNVSLRPIGEDKLYPKTEIKNVNSFRSVERALEFEIVRQTKLWDAGTPPQTLATRGFTDTTGETVEQRAKEEAHDYRYFPEPDLPPLELTTTVERLRGHVPELPAARRARLIAEYGFTENDVAVICGDRQLADFTELTLSELRAWLAATPTADERRFDWDRDRAEIIKTAGGWILTKLIGVMSDRKVDWADLKVTPENMAELISLVRLNKVTGQNALLILEDMVDCGSDPSQVMEEKNLGLSDDFAELEAIAANVVVANPNAVADWQKGKTNAVQFLVGQVMKAARGKAAPDKARELIERELAKLE